LRRAGANAMKVITSTLAATKRRPF